MLANITSTLHSEDKKGKLIHLAGLPWTDANKSEHNPLISVSIFPPNTIQCPVKLSLSFSLFFSRHLTSTILAHWVPFPAPGPPNTNTTCGFMINAALYTTLGTFTDNLLNKWKIINRQPNNTLTESGSTRSLNEEQI